MRPKFFSALFICVSLSFLFWSGCKKATEKPKEEAIRYKKVPTTVAEQLKEKLDLDKEVISQPPSLISASSSLTITFRRPVVPPHQVGHILDKTPFKFTPAVKGTAKWISQREIKFTPADYWPAGKKFKGILLGKIAFGRQKEVNDFRFSFKVAEQEVLSLEGDFTPVPEQENVVRYEGILTFAQKVKIEQIKKDLKLRGPKRKNLKIEISKEENERKIKIISANITQQSVGQSFVLSLPAKYTAGKSRWVKSLFLPGIHEFKVIAHFDLTEPGDRKHSYGFRFNEPIKKNLDLSGYITVRPPVEFQTRIDNKYLILTGDFLPGETYQVTISQNFPSIYGTSTRGDYIASIGFSNIKPEVKWLSEGVYLPTSNNYKLQFKSVNVRRVRISITEIYPQNIGFFIQKNILKELVYRDDNYYYDTPSYQDLSRVGEEIYYKTIEITQTRNQWIKTEIDLTPIFKKKKRSLFVVSLRFNQDDLTGEPTNDREKVKTGGLYFADSSYYTDPCESGYYYSRGIQSKLLIFSDVAITVKKADDGIHTWAINTLTAKPMAGVKLSLYNFQNKLLETKTTNENGYVLFKKGEGSYIYSLHQSGIILFKLDHPGWVLNNFDISGKNKTQGETIAFIYLDRGVHRPGDTVHLSAIIRFGLKNPPAGVPVILKVKNPLGQEVFEKKTEAGEGGHIYFPIPTKPSDPTGDWQARLKVGGRTFYKTLKIETVKPFRLKISHTFPQEINAPAKTLQGTITAKYLFGAPAANLRVKVKMRLREKKFSLPQYERYIFSSPLNYFSPRTMEILDEKLNQKGASSVNYSLPDFSQVPSLLSGTLLMEVYEKGGNAVRQAHSLTIYPYQGYIGIKNVFKWGRARLKEKYKIPVMVVDKKGNLLPDHRLKVKHYVNQRYWWWDYDRDDRRDFRSHSGTYLISEQTYQSTTTPLILQIEIEDQGKHFIEVIDETGGHQAGLFFYASRWGRAYVAEEKKERNYLSITADKNVYYPGDKATLKFETPQKGMALLTVEQGDQILIRKWKNISSNPASFTFSITPEMLPNCYALISLIQPHNQNTNDLPMRLYGLKTLYVEDPGTRLNLTLTTPPKIRPKETFIVKVSSQSPQKATYTIAIVDEGLLDLTNFKTPSPWDYFFQKVRLGVRTSDNFDQIIGTLYPDITKYFSIGGGDFEEERKRRLSPVKTRRFKPVVLFQKPTSISSGETMSHKFTMPNYVGAVRVMMVGASGNSYVSREKVVPVKQELMILPTVPRVARPGDVFSLPVSVFAMEREIKQVTVSVSTSSNLSVLGNDTTSLSFAKPEEKDTRFLIKVGEVVGEGKITVKAVAGNFKTDYTVTFPINSPNPFYTEVLEAVVVRGKPVTFTPQKFGLEGTNKAQIAFSRVPDIQLDKRLNYLIRYPYGCIEQTTSSVFPQLFLHYLLDLNPYQKQRITDNINAAIERLTLFKVNGGFSFWPGGREFSDWGTSYAGHFLILARNAGYYVPDHLYHHGIAALKKRAKVANQKNHRYQTYRLFLLALAEKPSLGAMNLVRENFLSQLDPLSREFLAAAYHLAGRKEIAQQIHRYSIEEITHYREMSGTYGSALRDLALIGYLSTVINDQRTAITCLQRIAKSFKPNFWYSTQETAMALLCLSYYYKKYPFTDGAIEFILKMEGRKKQKILLTGYQKKIDVSEMWNKKITISTPHHSSLFVSLLTEGIPLKSKIQTENKGIELKRNFYDEEGHPVVVTNIKQNEPFWVVYRIKNLSGNPLEELALTSLFPAGWEIVNPRMSQEEKPEWVSRLARGRAEYIDIRDDRVNWFFKLRSLSSAVFAVKIIPTFKGTYTLPPVVVEPMYHPEFFARIKGGTVKVK